MNDQIPVTAQGSIVAPLRSVTHGLANAVGLLKTVSGEFDKMSPDAAFLARGIVERLGEILGECAQVYETVSQASQDASRHSTE